MRLWYHLLSGLALSHLKPYTRVNLLLPQPLVNRSSSYGRVIALPLY
jgi:hypothetical protein